jgi:hypothetical protein
VVFMCFDEGGLKLLVEYTFRNYARAFNATGRQHVEITKPMQSNLSQFFITILVASKVQ